MYADSIDDNIEQVRRGPASSTQTVLLAQRIGGTKVYLPPESSASRLGKHKRHEDEDLKNDDEMDEDDVTYRRNALLLHGSPISELPTARIFAYATHFDVHPMALEWVDDNTCVLVFRTRAAAREAEGRLQKVADEEPDAEGFQTAQPIPVSIWSPEHRIRNTLGKGEGLREVILLRWAYHADVKKKDARGESAFYKRHGSKAGKDPSDGLDLPSVKRRRETDEVDDARRKAELDEELERFLAADDADSENVELPSPPSKMRSDYIASDGRTLLQQPSFLHAHPETLAERLMAPLPRRPRGGRRQHDGSHVDDVRTHIGTEDALDRGLGGSERRGRSSNGDTWRQGRRDRGERSARPLKTQQELDDELDTFLREGQ